MQKKGGGERIVQVSLAVLSLNRKFQYITASLN